MRQATVVPAKAGIQEIPRKRANRLSSFLDSGFRRNDGFMMGSGGYDWFRAMTGSGQCRVYDEIARFSRQRLPELKPTILSPGY